MGRITKSTMVLIALSLFGFSAYTQQNKAVASEDDIKADLDLVKCKNKERLESVKSLFAGKGAAEADVTIEDAFIGMLRGENFGKTMVQIS